MSDTQQPRPPETTPTATTASGQTAGERRRRSPVRWLLFLTLVLSLALNGLLISTLPGCNSALEEHYYSGKSTAHGKIAVIHVDGVILEGMNGYADKQIERDAADSSV